MTYSLTIQKGLPALIGINHTHIICQIEYLIRRGEDKRMTVDENGTEWLSKTYQEWHKTFDWLSLSGLRKCFRQLKQWGYIQIIQGRDRNQFALTELGKSLFNGEQPEPETESLQSDEQSELGPTLSISQGVTEYQSGCHSVTPLSYINKKNNKTKNITTGGNTSTVISNRTPPNPPPDDILIPFRDKLCEICELDPKLSRNKRKVKPVAMELIEAGYTMANLDQLAKYVANDFHFRDINLGQIPENIRKAVLVYGSGQTDKSGLFKKKSAAPASQYPNKGDYSEMYGHLWTDAPQQEAV